MTWERARWWHLVTVLVSGAALVLQLVLVLASDANPLSTRLFRLVSFFTIESNILVCIGAAALVVDPARDGPWWRVLRLAGVIGITVTGLVYVTVLRGLVELTPAGRVADTGLHYLTPALAVLGWLLFGPRPRIDRRTVGLALVFPVAWLVYTLVRGEVTDSYPYPFVDVTTNGYATVLVNCVLITALFLVVSGLLWLADRRLRPAPSDRVG